MQPSSTAFTPAQIQSAVSSIKGTAQPSSLATSFTAPRTLPASNTDSYGSQVENAFEGGLNQTKQAGQDISQETNPIKGGEEALSGESGIASMISSPIAPLFKPISDAINSLGDKIGNVKSVQEFATTPIGKTVARVAQDLANAGNVSGTIAGVEGLQKGIGAVSDAVDSATTPKPVVEPQDVQTKIGVENATPDYNKKMVGQSVTDENGNVSPRVSENTKMTGGRTVNPSLSEKAAGNETVTNFPSKGTALEQLNSIQPEIAKEAQNLKTGLAKEDFPVTPTKMQMIVNDALDKVPDDSMILAKTDPAIKTYTNLVNKISTTVDRNLGGVQALRQALDDAYENSRGKMAYGSDKLTALDQIHTAARDALNDFTKENAKSVDVKASLQRQTNLYRAADVLKTKAEAEGGNTVTRFLDNHPVAKGVSSFGRRVSYRLVAGTAARALMGALKNI